MNVLFWGSPEFAVDSLERISDGPHRVVGVVCRPDRAKGRGLRLQPPAVKQAAQSLGLKILQPELPRGQEFIEQIRGLDPDVSVVVAYGHILKPEVLAVPRHGSINLHASLLPAYRGAAPVQRAIAAGETHTGITVIRMDQGMDTGDILAQNRVEIGPEETAGELARRLAVLGADLLLEVLANLASGNLKPAPQGHRGVSYAPRIERGQARIDWTLPADQVSCLVRAFDPAPGAFCLRSDTQLKLFRPRTGSQVSAAPGEVTWIGDDCFSVCCGDSRAVQFFQAQAEGRKRLPVSEFLRGARLTLGEKLG